MKNNSRLIFVAGAAGFVASHLVPLLLNKGFKVIALIRTAKEQSQIDQRAKIIVGDLTESGNWCQQLTNCQTIIHLAAQISSKNTNDFKRNNVEGTANLVKAAKKTKIKKIILFSSAAVGSIRQDEYSKTKKKQEEIIVNSKINYVILRPSMIYGPGDTKNIGWLIKIVKLLPIIPLPDGNFGRQPVFVGDICQIVLKILGQKYRKKLYEIYGFEYVTLDQMVKTIIKNIDGFKMIIKVPLVFFKAPFWLAERTLPNPKFTMDQIESIISGEKFKGDKWWAIFKINPTSFEAGIKVMLKRN